MKRILIAPNAFKNSVDATAAASAIEKGLQESRLECTTQIFPVGDGGDGTCRLITDHLKGDRKVCEVTDPLGRKIQASFGLIREDKTAVIEMADASGLKLIGHEERNPLITTSTGTGEMISAALDAGVEKIIVGMGGSATVDGGCGILYALGCRFIGPYGNSLSPVPKELTHAEEVDLSQLDKRLLHTEITVLCDVKNKLLGKNGAAAVFGPQKGASEDDVRFLERFFKRLSGRTRVATGRDMSAIVSGGAAGGAAGGMWALANARLVSGIQYFLELTGFEEEVKRADCVITAEGSIDDQTLDGKGPFGVAAVAKKYGKKVIALGGKIPLQPSKELLEVFDVLVPVNNSLMPSEEAIKATKVNLVRTGKMIGDLLEG